MRTLHQCICYGLQKGIAISLEGRHLVLTLFWLVAPHVSSRYKKSHSFQSLPLFWILYNDFLKFLGNRDKEFKLGPRYMNFRLYWELHHQLHNSYLNIRSDHEIETATLGFSQVPLKTFVKLALDINHFYIGSNHSY